MINYNHTTPALLAAALLLAACNTPSDTGDSTSSSSATSSVGTVASSAATSSGSSSYAYDSNDVKLMQPEPRTRTTSPLVVDGMARGNWFFEANIPLELQTADGEVLVETSTTTSSDWMTTDLVPFMASIDFDVEEETQAVLLVKKSNASGLPENDDWVSIPVTLLPAASSAMSDGMMDSGSGV